MNKFFAIAVSGAALCGAVFADGIEIKLNKPSDWKPHAAVKWVGPKKDVMQVTGPAMLLSSKSYDIVPAKKYKLEADVKGVAGGPSHTYFGFNPLDKSGRMIGAGHVNVLANSETSLVKAAKAGDKVISIKANPVWNSKRRYTVVFNAKKDYSDLPNFDFAVIGGVKEVNGIMEVALKTPVKKNVAAGTAVRVHCGGGYMYSGGYRKLADGQKVELKGTVAGMAKTGVGYRSWTPGTAKAQVLLLVNWGGSKKAVTEIKDVELEIE